MKQVPAADLLTLPEGWEIAYDIEFGLLFASTDTMYKHPAYVAWAPVVDVEDGHTHVTVPINGTPTDVPAMMPVVVREAIR